MLELPLRGFEARISGGFGAMSKEARLMCRLVLALSWLLLAAWPVSARQDSSTSGAQAPSRSSQPPDAAQATPSADSDSQKTPDIAPPGTQSPPAAPAETPKEPRKESPETHTYSLTEDYSVSLTPDWTARATGDVPPPAPLSSYAPFHLSGNLVLWNAARGTVLQFAISNNPFVGHDSYWLDTQMHSPSGSGMSLLDLFFYYFFPPSDACIHQVLTTYAPASRLNPLEGPAYMQVYYSCPLSDTLSDFYAAQVSAGITFQHTDNGTRVLAPVGDFYVAPMEQIEDSGITFFVFEAQGMNAVSSDAAGRFHLPDNAQGGQPDFFWAIGAASPFPFVTDASRKDAILHVAYARLGVDADAKGEFLSILRAIRTR